MAEYIITFTHPDGRLEGLTARDAVEKELTKRGFYFWSGGTNFKRKGKPKTYLSTELTVERKGGRFPEATIREVLKAFKVRTFKVTQKG